MGQTVQKTIKYFSPKAQKKIVLMGLDSSGKTSIIDHIKLKNTVESTQYSFFITLEVFTYQNLQLTVLDSKCQLQTILQTSYNQFKGSDALIYVIDSSDSERMNVAIQDMYTCLFRIEKDKTPVLIFANQQDKAVMSLQDISEKLKLNTSQYVSEWHIQGCCALNGEGIYEGFDWLSKVLNKQM